MSFIKQKIRWTKKPDSDVRIDSSHPFAENIKFAMWTGDGGNLQHFDAATGKLYPRSSATYSSRKVDMHGRFTDFAGTGTSTFDAIQLGDPPELQISEEITILAGVMPTALQPSNWGRIVAKDDIWGLIVQDYPNDGQLSFRVNGTGLNGSAQLVNDVYYDLAVTYKSGDKNIYIDGVLDANTTGQTGSITTAGDVSIGERPAQTNRHFIGGIYYVVVVDKALSQKEIQEFRSNPTKILAPQVRYIPFEVSAAGGVINSITLSDNLDVTDPELKAYRELFALLSSNIELVDVVIISLQQTAGQNTRLLNDELVIVDNLIKFATLFKLVNENVELSDSLSKTLETFKLLSEGIDLSDSLISELTGLIVRNLTDDIEISEEVNHYSQLFKLFNDGLDITDSLLTLTGTVVVRLLQDGLDITDAISITIIRNKLVSLLDNVTISDDLIKSLESLKVLSDNLDVSDALIKSLVQALKERLLSDNISVSDSISIALQTALIAASLIKSDLELKAIITSILMKDINTDLEN